MASDQIRQMVNFILQEAHEKANEIRVKTEHDFNLEKQTLVHEAKLAIQEEFAKKEKDREIQERIARSAEIGECNVKKMKLRDELLQGLIKDAGAKCGMVARGQNYPQLIQKLIVQGLIKIEEMEVVIYCRQEDVSIVEQMLPGAVSEYVEIMERESGIKLSPKVQVNKDRSRDLSDSSYGGVKLTACDGKIVCDNTMSARLELVYEELLPSIREILFPEDAAASA
jgi:V-type H+-transporting ATPase subunit E